MPSKEELEEFKQIVLKLSEENYKKLVAYYYELTKDESDEIEEK